ncbi:MAG: hypothetical protein K0Q79_3189 [Flavipsychrobacter sp.]|jgi:hypothetical protein|nr:hypothetical protein [Flavipsychrobacter sp.]
MKKTVLYLVILLILGFGVYYFLIKPDSTGYSQSEAGFTVKDTSAIGKIFLVSPDGESILVERTDSGWMVNKQYKALPSTLNLLLKTFVQQAALYPVTKNALDNAIKIMATDHIKTEIYDRAGKKITSFYVGGAAVNNTGTNMLMEGAETPYVVHITSFNGALTPRYTTRITDWRDRTIFNMPPEEIKSVSVKYIEKPINSFEIVRDGENVTINADPRIVKHLDSPNYRRARVFLKYFTNVNCEGYLNGLPDNDTTIKTAPRYCTIELNGLHGQHQSVDIYWMAINKRSKNLTVSNPYVPDGYDADRLYAIINNYKDTVLIQQWAFRNIFHNAYEFFQKDGTTSIPDFVQPGAEKNVILQRKK